MTDGSTGGPAAPARAGRTAAAAPATVPEPPRPEHHHRDVHGGTGRAAVFGASDGLVSNVSLILGVAGADPAPGVVRLAGLAGLLAGAVSMAAGEYVSMKAHTELLQRELELERRELRRNPHVETVELAQIYASRGLGADDSRRLAEAMMSDPERALEAHAREELGVDPHDLGSPVRAAVSSFFSFAAGAVLPLLPWLFAAHAGAVLASVLLGVVGAAAVGLALSRFTGRSPLVAAARQVLIAAVAASVTFLVGRLVGVGVN
ncbi:MAG: VIT1/CCC1 transporter family protein [Actinobacteria bacterium]|nr:VIT1/CCC1 transporter family protein [Actinomycetota bacterium]